jgi:hypothetical protein
VISYANRGIVSSCYSSLPSSNISLDGIASPITSISLYDWNGRYVEVSGLLEPIVFNHSIATLVDDYGMSTINPSGRCSFIDRWTNRWSSQGCRTLITPSYISCSCDHLTEFAVWSQTITPITSYVEALFTLLDPSPY